MAEWNTRVLDFMGRKSVHRVLIGAATAAVMSFVIWRYPPVQTVPRGEVAVRNSDLTGHVEVFTAGSLWAVPTVYPPRRFSLRDPAWRSAIVALR